MSKSPKHRATDLVHNKGGALGEVDDALVGEVEHAPGRANDDVHRLHEADDILLQIRATGALRCNWQAKHTKGRRISKQSAPQQCRLQ